MSEKEEFQRFSISLPSNLFTEFEEFRKKNNLSRSDSIRKAMQDYMSKETENERILSKDHATALIILRLEHAYVIKEEKHNHEHLSADQHTEEHSIGHSHGNLEDILDAKYFTYPDTDLIKINHIEHLFHDIVITKLHVHTEHSKCLLILPVKGPGKRIKEFYNKIIKLRSVISHELIIED